DLFVGVDSGVTQAMTRNDVAQLVLNTLKSGTVQAETNGSLTVGNVTIATDVKYSYITSNQTYANAISSDKSTSNTTDANRSIVELGEKLYNGDLKLDEDTTDVFGRPARTWSYEGEEIGTFAQKELLAAEFTTAVTGKELYDVVGKTAYDKYDFESYVDGEENGLYKEISRNNRSDVSNTDNGALTQVFVDTDDEIVTVTVINTYLAQANADYNEKKDTVTLKVYGKTADDKSISNQTVSGEDFYIEDLEKDDFVLVTYADDEIQSMDDVKIIADTEISKFSANGSEVTAVTVDGTKYDASAKLEYDEKVLDDYTDNNLKDTTYNVYLDQYGYVIGVDIVDKVDNYLFITGVDDASSNLSTKSWDANAIFMDGTSKVIEVKNDGTLKNDGPIINKWFSYTVSKDDVYSLTAIEDKNEIAFDDDGDVAQNHSTEGEVPKIDDKHISVPGIDSRVYGNDESVYLLAELDKVVTGKLSYAVIKGADEVVIGVDNAAFETWGWKDASENAGKTSVDYSTDSSRDNYGDNVFSYGTYALYNDDGYVIAAVVVGESGTTTSKVAFALTDDLEDESYDKNAEEWTWTRKVVIDGEEVLLTETSDENKSVLEDDMDQYNWYTVKYDADGNVRDVELFDDASEYAITIADAVKLIKADQKDLIVADIGRTGHVYDLKGKTLYNVTTGEEGFRIAEDANIVLRQQNNNKWTTTYETGVSALESILDDLNTTHDYSFDAVIEDGRATSVIIVDYALDNDYTGPSGDTNDGSLALNALSFSENGMKVNFTNNSGSNFETGARAKVVVKNADGYQVCALDNVQVTKDSVANGASADITFDGFKAVPSNTGNYTVTLTITSAHGTFTVTRTLGTI
ncbi:hypothetical protein, partial [Pseudoflavonifractor capillosus]|uniref:hypothetical protein n=1 Tax=Pseudoflavonifractor capillosus TaxID=106588 RepID=UPI0019573D55